MQRLPKALKGEDAFVGLLGTPFLGLLGRRELSAQDQASGSRAGAAKSAATMEEDERPQSPEDDEEATRKPTAVERRLELDLRQEELQLRLKIAFVSTLPFSIKLKIEQ